MLKTLQAGRGIAALSVAAFHLSLLQQQSSYGGYSPFSAIAGKGGFGVDFFFVLSGFIIARAHENDIGHAGKWMPFLQKRFIRVFPVYWLFTALTIASVLAGWGSTPVPRDTADWLTTILLVRVSPFLTPLHQAWTLFHEIVFYALYSLCILNRRLGYVALLAWGGITAGMYFYSDAAHQSLEANLFAAWNLNFLFGLAASKLDSRLRPGTAWLAAVAAVCLLAVLFFADRPQHSFSVWRPLYGIAFAALIGSVVRLELSSQRPPKLPVLSLLGDASYAIYLIHDHLETHLLRLLFRINAEEWLPQAAIFAFVMLVVAMSGVVVHLVIERPLLRLLRERLLPARQSEILITAD